MGVHNELLITFYFSLPHVFLRYVKCCSSVGVSLFINNVDFAVETACTTLFLAKIKYSSSTEAALLAVGLRYDSWEVPVCEYLAGGTVLLCIFNI